MSADKFARVPVSGKITIASLDNGPKVTAQYNPKELQVDLNVPWQKTNEANKANSAAGSQGIHLEFTGAEGRSVTFELVFDGYEDGFDVAAEVANLETLASVRKPGSKREEDRRPHRCIAIWGTSMKGADHKGKKGFPCVIESVQTKYTMFDAKGTPLRATCTVKLKEANVLSLAKDEPATGGTTGGRGGRA